MNTTLDLHGHSTDLAGLNGSIVVALGNTPSLLTISNATQQVFMGTISGAGSVAKAGAGELVLGGVNSYQAETVVAEGILRITTTDALAAVGSTEQTGTRVTGTGVLALDGVVPNGEFITVVKTTPTDTHRCCTWRRARVSPRTEE